MDLNQSQKLAIQEPGHCMIVACPGSGKTRTLIEKAAHLLSEDFNHRILLCTFTDKSATEIRERLIHRVGPEVAKRANTGTFHKFCKTQLEKGFGRRLNLITNGPYYELIRRAAVECGVDVNDAILIIEHAKSRLDSVAPEHKPLLTCYQEMLNRNQQLDMHDLILRSVRAMRAGELKCFPHSHIFVDEFQDTDNVQYEWLKFHGQSATITVVGDDDQSIYGWRHAMGYSGMERFANEFQARVINLEINYRSHHEIVASASRLVNHNTERVGKNIVAFSGTGGVVTLLTLDGVHQESYAIVKHVQDKPESWAVLARRNRDLDQVEAALSSFNIPYQRKDGGSIYSKLAVTLLFNLFEIFSSNKPAYAGLESILAWSGLSADSLNKISKFGIGDIALFLDTLPVDAHERLFIKEFVTKMKGWMAMCASGEINLAIMGACAWMVKFAKDPKDEAWINMATDAMLNLSGSIAQRTAFLSGLTKPKQQEQKGVALLTMHSSKGLEFDNVWMIRAEDGICPSENSPLSEERRLFYVGMTRAKKNLMISQTGLKPSSVFLFESGLFASLTS